MSKLAACASTRSESPCGDTLDHIFCECDEDLGLCGANISDSVIVIVDHLDDGEACIVCLDLEFVPCPRCGM